MSLNQSQQSTTVVEGLGPKRRGQESSTALIPVPQSVDESEGKFLVDAKTAIVIVGDAGCEAEYLRRCLAQSTGVPIPIMPLSQPIPEGAIVLRVDDGLTSIAKEGYRLESTPERVSIDAVDNAGLFYGVQTLLQLLPASVFSTVSTELSIPCLTIEDHPQFSWRGLMLDVCRYFMPLDFVKRLIDLMAMHKLNVLHLHLTDDQGWRVEIKKYPRLTEIGAFRPETLVGHLDDNRAEPRFDGAPHGGFYTRDELRDLVDYSRSRHIDIMPEIEMPGHAQAAVAAYPELGNTGRQIEVGTTWGVMEDIFNAEESTIEFLQDVLTEVMDIFPFRYIHIGGDEAVKTQWKASAAAQRRIRELGLSNENELQAYIVKRMDDFLTSRGRRLVGWDEIIEGGLAKNATVMSWRNELGGIDASNRGHDVIMAPVHQTYLDLRQAEELDDEPIAQEGYLPIEKVYRYHPVPSAIAADKVHHILGAQAQVWTEYIPTPAHVEYMVFPRLCAFAEVCWSSNAERDFEEFRSRLETHLRRLDALSVNYRRLDPGR